MHDALTNPALIPLNVPRLYTYSTTDTFVPYKDVEAHIEQAKAHEAKTITTFRADRAEHVSLLRLDSVAYWARIKTLWESTLG